MSSAWVRPSGAFLFSLLPPASDNILSFFKTLFESVFGGRFATGLSPSPPKKYLKNKTLQLPSSPTPSPPQTAREFGLAFLVFSVYISCMLVLGIESTCDETGAALVREGRTILSNVVASSADVHRRYGGVFPELACRRHIDALLPVLEEAFQRAGVRPEEIDRIAVAQGPGLIGALLIGLNAAKGLALAWNKPLVGVNHVEAHLFAALMGEEALPPFPALGVVLSGGHTLLLLVHEIGRYEPIATTVDDAVGEAFDKVAALLGLPYPGGPEIERAARQGDSKRFPFRAGLVKRSPLDFSFSGLKTGVLYALKELKEPLSEQTRADVAASFQETALKDVVYKAKKALERTPCRSILLGGGVCCNERLKALFSEEFSHLPIFWPPKGLSLDNAAMIAGLGTYKPIEENPLALEALTRIPFAKLRDFSV